MQTNQANFCPIKLTQFEAIDGLMSSILRMGPFENCVNPREYIRMENRLLDACYDAIGVTRTDSYASALEAAAELVAHCLISPSLIIDEEGE